MQFIQPIKVKNGKIKKKETSLWSPSLEVTSHRKIVNILNRYLLKRLFTLFVKSFILLRITHMCEMCKMKHERPDPVSTHWYEASVASSVPKYTHVSLSFKC